MNLIRLSVAAILFLAAQLGFAQGWPSKPIRFIVPWPASGLNDIVSRAYNDRVGKALGQPLVLENRPGAAGVVGTAEAARAAPDGYTLAMGTLGALTIVPHLRHDLTYTPKSFAPVAMLAISPLVIAVSNELKVKSLGEFITLAKSKPAALNFGVPGVGSTMHLGFEVFKQVSGIDVTTVPYKGTSDALVALLAGQVQVMFDPLGTLLAQIRAGKIRALAVTTPERALTLPEVPTLAELGFGAANIFTWHVVLAPAATPVQILDRLYNEYAAAAQSPEVQAMLAQQGLAYLPSTRKQLVERIETESLVRKKIIADRGIRLQ